MARGFGISFSVLAAIVAAAAVSACSGAPNGDDANASESNLSAAQCAAAKPWAPNVAYKVGDVVSFQGVVYTVRQAHTSLSVWPPNIVPALFAPADCNGVAAPPPPPPVKPPPTATTPPPPPPPPPANNGGGANGGGGQTGAAAGFVFCPYKDTSINLNFNTNVASTRVSGNLTTLASDIASAGGRTVTLAFATGECGNESWGGVQGAAMAAANVGPLTQAGVKYIVATGGAAGSFTCGSDAGMEAFIGRWASSNLIGVDLDIEVGQSDAQIDSLMKRVKAAHAKHPGLRFSLTLATIAQSKPGQTKAASFGGGQAGESLNATGAATIAAVKNNFGFNGSAATWPSFITVNLMTMDYGAGSSGICVFANGECDMGESAAQAAFNLRDKFGVPLSAVELTPMIGGNDVQANRFKIGDVDTVSRFALSNGLAGVHFWSYDRDVDCAPGPASATCNTIGGVGAHGYLKRFLAGGLK